MDGSRNPWHAAAIRSLQTHARSTRRSQEHRGWACFRTFPSFPRIQGRRRPPGHRHGARARERPPLPAAALGRHPVVPLGAAASEGARERRRTGWQSLRDSDPRGCRATESLWYVGTCSGKWWAPRPSCHRSTHTMYAVVHGVAPVPCCPGGNRPLTAPVKPGSDAASHAPLPGCCVTRLL